MIFDENSPVRYLMKEMDPSEEMLFEKKMLEDEDLLIEVESLRKINCRLSKLPVLNPPVGLTRQILREASEHYHQKEQDRSRVFFLSVSAAATVLVMFFAGAFWILEDDRAGTPDSSSTQASVGVPAPLNLQSESTAASPSPWVDNNQELHFNDRFDAENSAAFDSILH